MGTIVEKLNKLLGTKAAIKAAIIEKGQDAGDVFADYPDKIRAIQSGLDTSDADASASDICKYKTAYVNSRKITGTVTEELEGSVAVSNFDELYQDNEYVGVDGTYDKDILFRAGSYVKVLAPLTSFGNATAADVASGKTFTSSEGLLVEGTASIPEQATVTIINDSSEDMRYYRKINETTLESGDSVELATYAPGNLIIRYAKTATYEVDGGIKKLRTLSSDNYTMGVFTISEAGAYTITIIDD